MLEISGAVDSQVDGTLFGEEEVAGSAVEVAFGCSLRMCEKHCCAVGYTRLQMMDYTYSSVADYRRSLEMDFASSSVADCSYFLVTDYTSW